MQPISLKAPVERSIGAFLSSVPLSEMEIKNLIDNFIFRNQRKATLLAFAACFFFGRWICDLGVIRWASGCRLRTFWLSVNC